MINTLIRLKAEKTRDLHDQQEIIEYLNLPQRNPFLTDVSLRSIATGAVASEGVNADNAKEVCETILNSMKGQSVSNFTFRRKNQDITLDTKTTVKIGEKEIQIDNQLLFQRLVVAGERTGALENLFTFELCSFPAALFDQPLILRAANKPLLADALWTTLANAQISHPVPAIDTNYVLDGGALLHRIAWPYASTY